MPMPRCGSDDGDGIATGRMAKGPDVIEVQTAEELVSPSPIPDRQLIEHVGQIACPEREIGLLEGARDIAFRKGNRGHVTGRDIANHHEAAAR